jgi:hypothetical protein
MGEREIGENFTRMEEKKNLREHEGRRPLGRSRCR